MADQTTQRLPTLFVERLANDLEAEVVSDLIALAAGHLRWIVGTDPDVDPDALSAAEIDARLTASVEAFKERTLALIDAAISDTLDIVQKLVKNREVS